MDTPPTTTQVENAQLRDIAGVVRVHQEAFAGFFLTLLGPRFLTELYRGFAKSESSIFLVYREKDLGVTGFVVGSTEPENFFRRLLVQRAPAFVYAAIPQLLAHPLVVGRKLLSGLIYRGDAPASIDRSALLSSIAVSKTSSRKGTGTALIQAFCREANARGCTSVYLLTDRDENADVNAFYVRSGFVIDSVLQKQQSRSMNRYLKKL